MWHNNVKIRYYYTHRVTQFAYATIEGLTGWKRVRPGATDGVANLGMLLAAAKANDRPVRVYIANDQIEQVMVS